MGMQNGMNQQRAPSIHPNQNNGFLNPNQMGSRPGSANGMNMMNRMTMLSGSDAHSMRGGDPNRYTPSIAPSERSNIGQASRYRPVQSQNLEGSTGFSSNATIMGDGSRSRQSSTIRVLDKPKSSPKADDDDDEGWGMMKKKNKKGKGKAREDDSGLSSLGYL